MSAICPAFACFACLCSAKKRGMQGGEEMSIFVHYYYYPASKLSQTPYSKGA